MVSALKGTCMVVRDIILDFYMLGVRLCFLTSFLTMQHLNLVRKESGSDPKKEGGEECHQVQQTKCAKTLS